MLMGKEDVSNKKKKKEKQSKRKEWREAGATIKFTENKRKKRN